MEIKFVFGVIAILLTLLGYADYFRSIWKGETKPHLFSWGSWVVATGVIAYMQLSAGAGYGAWATIALVGAMSGICLLSVYKKVTADILFSDWLVIGAMFFALGVWYIVGSGLWPMVILVTIEILGFIPTIRKTWVDPSTEPTLFYWITTLRHFLSILAVVDVNIVTMLYPSLWFLANLFFTVMLVYRRRILK